MDLTGKVAMVTGAAGGFGRQFVRAFLNSGASVAALDVDMAGLRDLNEQLADSAGRSRLMIRRTDVGTWTACEEAFRDVAKEFGPTHILVNNGAIGMSVIRQDHLTRPVPIEEISPAMWDRFSAVNFNAPWYLTRAAVGGMKQAGWGRIISITTNFATMLRGGFHPYGPCKAGLEAMAAGHAQEFSGSGITVNVVVPGGPADTPMVPIESGFRRDKLIAPEAMASPVLWLCGDEAADITGMRLVAMHWKAGLTTRVAAEACMTPIGWPQLAP